MQPLRRIALDPCELAPPVKVDKCALGLPPGGHGSSVVVEGFERITFASASLCHLTAEPSVLEPEGADRSPSTHPGRQEQTVTAGATLHRSAPASSATTQ